jgi:hypothetical protein
MLFSDFFEFLVGFLASFPTFGADGFLLFGRTCLSTNPQLTASGSQTLLVPVAGGSPRATIGLYWKLYGNRGIF